MLGLALSSPMPELNRLILPKAKRRPDAVDGHRDQPARIPALCRFILYPGGLIEAWVHNTSTASASASALSISLEKWLPPWMSRSHHRHDRIAQ